MSAASRIKENLDRAGYDLNLRCASFGVIILINFVALIVISGMGISGSLSPAFVGKMAIILTGANILLSLLSGQLNKEGLEKRKMLFLLQAIELIAIVTISALALRGILSSSQVGWGVIGISLGSFTITGISSCQKSPRA